MTGAQRREGRRNSGPKRSAWAIPLWALQDSVPSTLVCTTVRIGVTQSKPQARRAGLVSRPGAVGDL